MLIWPHDFMKCAVLFREGCFYFVIICFAGRFSLVIFFVFC